MQSNIKKFFCDVFLFFFSLGILLVFWENTFLVAVLLLIIFIVRSSFCYAKGDAVLYFTGFILGTSVDVICTQIGIWQYPLYDFWSIPVWVPFGWGITVVLIARISRNIQQCLNK